MKWCITNRNHVVTLVGECGIDTKRDQFAHLIQDGNSLHFDCPSVLPGFRFDGQVVTPRPEKPSDLYEFDEVYFSWRLKQNHMEEAKESAKLLVNGWRDVAERSGLSAYGKIFDSDDKSTQRLLGASQAAAIAKQLGQALSIEWTCADNTTLVMDADMLIEIPVVMAQAADALHKKARLLKERIDAATTLEEITSIAW